MEAASNAITEPARFSPAAADFADLAGKRIAIISYGSRGDVQPFVALGARLEEAGCHVRLLTNADHEEFVSSFGLEVVGTADSCRENFKRPEFVHGIATGDFMPFFAWEHGKRQRHMSEISQKERDAVESFGPDIIYATPLTYENACRMSERLGVPMILGSLFPAWNPLSMLGVRPFQPPKHPTLIHWSPALAKVPQWLRKSHHVTGFLVVEEQEREKQGPQQQTAAFGGDAELRRLEQFLAAGEPPVYMGWGSMIVPERTACLAVRALRRAGLRGVVLGGWARLGAHMPEGEPDQKELEEYIADNVLFVQSAPHEWLFPKCAATVHHGGAGTVAAALRSGMPTVITPCGLDQPDNARIVEASGCGVALGQISVLTVEDLARALARCTEDPEMRERCRAMGERLRSEDGLHATVAAIDRCLHERQAPHPAQPPAAPAHKVAEAVLAWHATQWRIAAQIAQRAATNAA